MKPYYQNNGFSLYQGNALDVLKGLESESVNCCVTSPPYFGLRNYGIPPTEWPEIEFSPMSGLPAIIIPAEKCCLGLEEKPLSYIGHCVYIFREVSRVLRDDATLWINLGDTYGTGTRSDRRPGNKSFGENTAKAQGIPRHGGIAKQLMGIPWKIAFALQADSWYLRSDIIWHKPSCLPESVKDRPTKSHEYIFLLAKSAKYYYDHEAIKEPGKDWGHRKRENSSWVKNEVNIGSQQTILKRPNDCDYSSGRNKRSVWTISPKPFKDAHFATFPPEIPLTCIKAGCPPGGVVLDPFNGSGTTGMVAHELGMKYIGIDIKKEYLDMTIKRAEADLNQTSIFDYV